MATKVTIHWTKGRGGRAQKGKETIKVKCNSGDGDALQAALHTWNRTKGNRKKVIVSHSVA